MNKMRVLQIVPSLNKSAGIVNVILNWHTNIDRTKVQFDYLYFHERPITFEEEIKNLGGNIYKLPYPSLLKPWIFIKAVIQFFKTHKYNTIHSHVIHLSFFFYPIAKIYGVKNIIHHSHTTKWSDKIFNGLRNRFMFLFVKPLITKKLACSDVAGKFLYKKNYEVINNGIDTEKFKFNQEIRNKMRKKLNIENKFVVGHVGRFSHEKNHSFLIDIFSEIYKQDKNSILLLVGDGVLRKKLEQKVKKLNLINNVIFTGVQSDITNYYQAMDVFVLPSLQEAFPVVGIEAQCSGLPCIFSKDVITNKVLICNSKQLSLNLSIKQWSKEVLKYQDYIIRDNSTFVKQFNFDIQYISKQIQNVYLNL